MFVICASIDGRFEVVEGYAGHSACEPTRLGVPNPRLYVNPLRLSGAITTLLAKMTSMAGYNPPCLMCSDSKLVGEKPREQLEFAEGISSIQISSFGEKLGAGVEV